jgi:hypothetical protein
MFHKKKIIPYIPNAVGIILSLGNLKFSSEHIV